MKKTILLLLSLAMFTTAFAAEKDTRCFELRIYYTAPGKLDDLHARFRNHTMKLFEKHGITNLGYWVPAENPDNRLIYLLAYPSREARDQSWQEFMGDEDWKAAYKASEANGPLVTKVDARILSATDYSPVASASVASEARTFEMRTYTASPGHLDDLNARFRNHTLALFQKHGMSNFGYWVPMKGQKGAADTLIYIVAHASKDAATASWKAFRDDPDWVAAKKASEEKAGGSLTTQDGVQSVFMKPTDYSPTR
jgi:hypothetical protein